MFGGLELIVQYPDPANYVCRGFYGLHLPTPCYVVFDGADIPDQGVANLLGSTFCHKVMTSAGVRERHAMPCAGILGRIGCPAEEDMTCRKILVRPVATGGGPNAFIWVPDVERNWLYNGGSPFWQVIPVAPAGTAIQQYLPPQWQGIQVAFWSRNPIEVLWTVLSQVGLAPEEARAFISYVRKDTSAVAEQLFVKLTDAGFDVFLDRCSVPVGVQFQERLMQELCDKAMMVLLNSSGVAKSEWVEEEIALAKVYRLGLLELRFPKGAKRSDIDPDHTIVLNRHDLRAAGVRYPKGSKKLSAGRLTDTVQRIQATHVSSLHRRRYELIDNFAAALTKAGRASKIMFDGTFVLPATSCSGKSVVGMSPRPPELADFCSLHQRANISATCPGWLVSPAPFFVGERRQAVNWLGGISNIQHADEAQMVKMAATL